MLTEILLSGLFGPSFAVFNALAKEKAKDVKDNIEENSKEVIEDLEKHTKIIRDLAIARRIDTAEKVTIEEFYEAKGDGKVGVQQTSAGIYAGLSGSGEKVTKRIYTFEGWRDGGLEGLNDDILKIIKEQMASSYSKDIILEETEEK